MELFLNLCWLSLLVPAYLLWRQRILCGSQGGGAGRSFVFFCALGCALILLFPVISASDDLHAMRAEMEESSRGKRSVCQASGEKVSVWHNRWQNLPAVAATAVSLRLTSVARVELLTDLLPLSVPPSILYASRAPPRSLLA